MIRIEIQIFLSGNGDVSNLGVVKKTNKILNDIPRKTTISNSAWQNKMFYELQIE